MGTDLVIFFLILYISHWRKNVLSLLANF